MRFVKQDHTRRLISPQTLSHRTGLRLFIVLFTICIVAMAGETSAASSVAPRDLVLSPTSETQGVQDFTIVANTSTVTIPNGSGVDVDLTVTSLNGFEGVVNIQAYVVSADSQSSDGLYLFWDHSSPRVRLTAGGSSHASLAVDGYQSHFHGMSQIWIEAEGPCLIHRISLTVIQPPLPSSSTFRISVEPTMLAIGSGNSGSARVSVTSLRGFSGLVSIIAIGTNASLNPKSLVLPVGETEVSQLTFQTPSNACPSAQDILIVATEGSTSQATTLALTTPTPSSSGGTPSPASQLASLLQSLRANVLLVFVALVAISGISATVALVRVKRTKHE